MIYFSQLVPVRYWCVRGRRDCVVVGFTTTCAITESVPIATEVVSSNSVHHDCVLDTTLFDQV